MSNIVIAVSALDERSDASRTNDTLTYINLFNPYQRWSRYRFQLSDNIDRQRTQYRPLVIKRSQALRERKFAS